MKKIISKAGYIAYEATENDSRKLGGIGVCDFCGKHAVTGYLIPVMNAYYCPECYKSWDENSVMYPEDLHIEKSVSLIMRPCCVSEVKSWNSISYIYERNVGDGK